MSRLVAVCSSIGLAAGGVAYTAYKGGEPVHARVTCSNQYKFPAGSNYPDILQHRNYMAQVLTPEVSFPVYILLHLLYYYVMFTYVLYLRETI